MSIFSLSLQLAENTDTYNVNAPGVPLNILSQHLQQGGQVDEYSPEEKIVSVVAERKITLSIYSDDGKYRLNDTRTLPDSGKTIRYAIELTLAEMFNSDSLEWLKGQEFRIEKHNHMDISFVLKEFVLSYGMVENK